MRTAAQIVSCFQSVHAQVRCHIFTVTAFLSIKIKWVSRVIFILQKCDSIATEMVAHFKETGHLVLKVISALSRGVLKRNGEVRGKRK